MRPKPTFPIQTSVSTYDRVSGMVTALVIMLGSVVVVEFLMWLSLREPEQRLTVEAELLGPELGEDERPEGEAQDIEEPGSEFPEVETPQIADSLEALSTALSSVPASDRDVDGSATEMGAGRGLGTRGGGGSGNGKGKSPWERWEIRYTTASKEAYAQQLDSLAAAAACICCN